MSDRRRFIKSAGIFLGVATTPAWLRAGTAEIGFEELPAGALDSQVLEALPGKLPLIKKSYRPPNFETPIDYFEDVFTPNNAFFVRYHLAGIPEVSASTWRLKIEGDSVDRAVEYSLADLKTQFQQVEIAAVCQCSGNRRGLFKPSVPGVIWGPGAMGNARWKGVRLKDVLAKSGVKKEALEVVLDGADSAPLPETPDFIKSIPVWKALDENTLIAFEMNGQPLPHWNGFPARLIVPGWTATYWMKHLTSVSVASKSWSGFWMNPAYRVPLGKFATVERFTSQDSATNTPITEMVVNSLITNLRAGQSVKAGSTVEVRGVAWDGGYGIARVDVSADSGKSWMQADLGEDFGRFSFRKWRMVLPKLERGSHLVMARASNRIGASQTFELIHNPAGYQHNVVQRIPIIVA